MDTFAPVAVVIPAAGLGRRLGGPRRKQFRLLGGKPVLLRTLEVFARHPRVERIVVALPADVEVYVQEQIARESLEAEVEFTGGGSTRQASVSRALARITPANPDMPVLVHDAVRPFVRQVDIDRVLQAIQEAGAAALAIPVADTLRKVDDGWFEKTISREGVFRMQTPQGARYRLLKEAFVRAESRGIEATDEVALLQEAGMRVRWVPGTPFNIKITTPEDWTFAEHFWPCWEQLQER